MYGNLKRGEDTEQMKVIDWARWNERKYSDLEALYHIPNGGKRDAREAARFKAMGVKAGVPDLHLPVPRGGYAGLYIEMKYGKNKTTKNQNEWLAYLRKLGNKTVVCYGADEAIKELEEYLAKERTYLIDVEDVTDGNEQIKNMIEYFAHEATKGNYPISKKSKIAEEQCLPFPDKKCCMNCISMHMAQWKMNKQEEKE